MALSSLTVGLAAFAPGEGMTMTGKGISARIAAVALALGVPTYAGAATIITAVNTNLLNGSYSFSFMGGSFTFAGMNTFPNYISVATGTTPMAPSGTTAAVRTVFGSPSTDFTNRGTVIYNQNTLGGYGSFASLTTVPTTNGDNFLGLRVTVAGQSYYGFAYTTNATLNSYGFETTANTAITATTAIPAAVPEPTSWAMMISGFGMIGGILRSRRRSVVTFA